MASWASPLTSGLATTTGRIEFVNLRTDSSLPVALHLLLQGRSYFPLMDSEQPMKGLAPFRSNAFTGALAGTLRVPSAESQKALLFEGYGTWNVPTTLLR
jgi:hypothetical protein